MIVPTDKVSIFEALNTLSMQGTRLALVRPNDPPPGVAGFIFDIEDENSSDLESDITDYYVETNIAVQDMIALRPETVTVTAQVAELVRTFTNSTITFTARRNSALDQALGVFSSVANSTLSALVTSQITGMMSQGSTASRAAMLLLPPIPSLIPQLTLGTLQRETQFIAVSDNIQKANLAANTLYGKYASEMPQQPNQTKQSLIYGYLYQLWKGRQLFSVETPWGFFNNMAILRLTARQSPETRQVSEFTVTFKKIRTVATQEIVPIAGAVPPTPPPMGQVAGRATAQQSAPSLGGVIGQEAVTTTEQLQIKLQTSNPFP